MAILITSIILALIGLALGGGGFWLVLLGGSFFYALAGVAFLVTAILLAMRKAAALWLYAAFVLAALAWAYGRSVSTGGSLARAVG